MTQETHPADKAKEEVLDDLMFTIDYDARSGKMVAKEAKQ